MHIWIERKCETKLTIRLLEEEAENIRKALVAASQNLVLNMEQHRLCNTLASALAEPDCPMSKEA